jgi:hypothetical protein
MVVLTFFCGIALDSLLGRASVQRRRTPADVLSGPAGMITLTTVFGAR